MREEGGNIAGFVVGPQLSESIISIFRRARWGKTGEVPRSSPVALKPGPLLRVCLHRDGVCSFVSLQSCNY